ncbi:MAG: AbrB/MazE/SpoVT family DNA-binding domain-containing protein [Thermomicrobiales bacterium]|nr:AbrB/MazE/SpoVT family DNA-binding domain-containing protein [Thermomicrobiales bacterium]
MSRYVSSVSPKGQITIPIEIREAFDISPKDHVAFSVVDQAIQIVPVRDRLQKFAGRYRSISEPRDWKELEELAHEEAAANALAESRDSASECD